jgi:diguanylate cyclase (GGDEF)-like protein
VTGDVAEQAVATLGLLDGEKTHPTDPGPHSDPDEMDRWYRQGLIAQRDALRAALHSLSEGNLKAIESVRRVTGAFGLRFLDRFPDLSKEGTAVSRLIDDEIVGRTEAFVGLIEAEVGLDRAKPARILLVEDEPTSAAKVRSMLAAPNREILHCTTRAEASTILTHQSIDLVLLDLSLPDADGRDLLVEIRDRPSTSAMPVIVLSSADGAQPQTEGFALGADAYFTKSVHPSVLSAAVSSFLQRAAQIRDQTLRDPLTGLKTRTVFISALSDTWVAMVRKTEPFTLAIIDVDRITALNDFHGREAGDAVLRDLGHRLKGLFRRSDLTARWGGDEFAVAFPHTDIEGARRALEKLQWEHSSAQEEHLAGGRHITFSAGVVSLETQESPEDAIEIAERRLVEAARGAGGRIVTDDDGLGPMSTTILVVEDDPLTAQLIAERLTRDNWNVVHMTDGMEALEAIPTMDVAAVLLDVATPGADGFGILRRLRRSPALAHVPIMMLTMDRETQVSRAFQMGATDILRKPFALSELVARVRTLVERG